MRGPSTRSFVNKTVEHPRLGKRESWLGENHRLSAKDNTNTSVATTSVIQTVVLRATSPPPPPHTHSSQNIDVLLKTSLHARTHARIIFEPKPKSYRKWTANHFGTLFSLGCSEVQSSVNRWMFSHLPGVNTKESLVRPHVRCSSVPLSCSAGETST